MATPLVLLRCHMHTSHAFMTNLPAPRVRAGLSSIIAAATFGWQRGSSARQSTINLLVLLFSESSSPRFTRIHKSRSKTFEYTAQTSLRTRTTVQRTTFIANTRSCLDVPGALHMNGEHQRRHDSAPHRRPQRTPLVPEPRKTREQGRKARGPLYRTLRPQRRTPAEASQT